MFVGSYQGSFRGGEGRCWTTAVVAVAGDIPVRMSLTTTAGLGGMCVQHRHVGTGLSIT